MGGVGKVVVLVPAVPSASFLSPRPRVSGALGPGRGRGEGTPRALAQPWRAGRGREGAMGEDRSEGLRKEPRRRGSRDSGVSGAGRTVRKG